jgi:hypothetical protein
MGWVTEELGFESGNGKEIHSSYSVIIVAAQAPFPGTGSARKQDFDFIVNLKFSLT